MTHGRDGASRPPFLKCYAIEWHFKKGRAIPRTPNKRQKMKNMIESVCGVAFALYAADQYGAIGFFAACAIIAGYAVVAAFIADLLAERRRA